MFRRAAGSLLARRFSPLATPRPTPARSLHSLRDLPIGVGLLGAAGVAAAGALAVQYFKKSTGVDESAARKEEDLKARFEDWMKKYDKSYRDEEEKTMRFQRFKATIEWMDSQPPSLQKTCFHHLGYFADSTEQEQRGMMSCPDELDRTQYSMLAMEIMAAHDKAALAAGGALAVQHFKKGKDVDESAARNKEEDMEARFDDWMEEHNKFYKDEEEKAMRFQRFKATVDTFSSPPETLNYFADWTDQETQKLLAPPDGPDDLEEYLNIVKVVFAKQEKGEPVMYFRDVKKVDTQATRVSA